MKLSRLAVVVSLTSFAISAAAAPAYVESPANAATVNDLAGALRLSLINQPDTGLTVVQRRGEIAFDPAIDFASADNNLTNTVNEGSPDSYLYKYLTADQSVTGNLSLNTGTTNVGGTTTPNFPLVLDLGEHELNVAGNLEMQGAIVVSTVNSFASSAGLITNGTAGLGVDSSRTGRFVAGELLEVASGTPANSRLLLDLNSTFEDGANYIIAQEDAGTGGRVFTYDDDDTTNSRLFDNSYVINSSVLRGTVGDNENITVTLQRADNEYIEKSFTRNHPSNDAALKLGRIAADGVALGDMQRALTLLDINDFGYGDNAQNLATQVKRLAPIANNSFILTHLDNIETVNGAVDYRLTARRGNWSGYRDRDNSAWIRSVQSATNSSGSVPESTADAQDNAGHDGYRSNSHGVSMGYDMSFKRGLIGLAYASLDSDIEQADDRAGEGSTQQQTITSLYAQLHGRNGYGAISVSQSEATVAGHRRTAVGRTAQHEFANEATVWRGQFGHRFDFGDGRTALTPHVTYNHADYVAPAYQETGAGALSLYLYEQAFTRNSIEVGASLSHKRRFNGYKLLSMLALSHGRDFDLADPTISARYTGDTHTSHAQYTTFTTPAEVWQRDFVKLALDLQMEPLRGVMLKLGLDAEFRQGRQRYTTDLGLVWAF